MIEANICGIVVQLRHDLQVIESGTYDRLTKLDRPLNKITAVISRVLSGSLSKASAENPEQYRKIGTSVYSSWTNDVDVETVFTQCVVLAVAGVRGGADSDAGADITPVTSSPTCCPRCVEGSRLP